MGFDMAASVRLYGRPAGILSADASGAMRFVYTPSWIEANRAGDPLAHSLSLRLPVRAEPYDEAFSGPYFDGLLPESKLARRALSEHLQIAEDNYSLLISLGRDCPGAVSIVRMDAPIVDESRAVPEFSFVAENKLAEMIEQLPTRPLFIDADGDLRLSLAGVNGKAAVLIVGGEIAIPHGSTPTSHILKVDIPNLKDSIRVEHFCLQLGAAMGLKTPKAAMHSVNGIPYMLLARYDRVIGDGPAGRYIRRLHQEDFCQALGQYPAGKYEKDGGPGWRECFGLLAQTMIPAQARENLIRQAIFQYLINNPDAHSKNYSLVYHAPGLEISRAYDINNAAAFRAQFKAVRPRLAMSVGGEFDPTKLTANHWTDFAKNAEVRSDLVLPLLQSMALSMPEQAINLRAHMRGTIADSPLLDIVIDDVVQRCAAVEEQLADASDQSVTVSPR